MNIRANRYNDPALGAAFESLASIFAPPSAQDLVAYSTAKAKKDEAERLSWLFNNPNDPLADRKATMAGVYAPTQSYYAVDQNTATTRRGQDVSAATTMRGQDVSAATARANNAADNQRATITSMYGPLNQGQLRPDVPADVAGVLGLPAMPGVAGAPKPLSETEVKGAERARLAQNGTLTDQMLLDSIIGAEAPVKTVGPNGNPIYSTPGAAARTGAPAYVDQGSRPAPKNGMAMLADGRQVPAVQDPNTGRWKHAQTGADLPSDIRVFNTPSPVGTNEQVGVGKPVANNIDQQLIDVAVAKDTAVKLRDMIGSSPASQGMVGWLRGTAQNVIATGGEVGSYFGGGVQEVTDAIRSGAADANLAGAFDPNIPAIEMMANLLAFQYAKTTTGERLSNEMLRAARAALGLEGITTNQQDATARINTAIKQMESQENILRGIRTNGVGGGQPAAPAAPAAAPAGGAARMKFDAEGNLIQ